MSLRLYCEVAGHSGPVMGQCFRNVLTHSLFGPLPRWRWLGRGADANVPWAAARTGQMRESRLSRFTLACAAKLSTMPHCLSSPCKGLVPLPLPPARPLQGERFAFTPHAADSPSGTSPLLLPYANPSLMPPALTPRAGGFCAWRSFGDVGTRTNCRKRQGRPISAAPDVARLFRLKLLLPCKLPCH